MKRLLIGVGILASMATAGCHESERQRAQAHEDFLKRHLGVAGHAGDPDTHAGRRTGDGGGHAPSAH